MTGPAGRKIVLTADECAVISQAVEQAIGLDSVSIVDLREQAGLPTPEMLDRLAALEDLLAARVSVRAKLAYGSGTAAERAQSTIVLNLARDEARIIVSAVLASVDFDDDRIAGILADSIDGSPGASALAAREAFVGRNAARLASIQKLYPAAGIRSMRLPGASV